jgi:O-antigen ligase
MESSALSRYTIAEANLRMAQDYPLGAGYRGNETLSAYYIPPEFLATESSTRSAHNTILAILVDQGSPGVVLFTVLVAWGAARLIALLFLDKLGLPAELGGFRAAIGASLAALLVSGQFVNVLHLEVSIWLIAMLGALDSMCAEWRRRNVPAPADASLRPAGPQKSPSDLPPRPFSFPKAKPAPRDQFARPMN